MALDIYSMHRLALSCMRRYVELSAPSLSFSSLTRCSVSHPARLAAGTSRLCALCRLQTLRKHAQHVSESAGAWQGEDVDYDVDRVSELLWGGVDTRRAHLPCRQIQTQGRGRMCGAARAGFL